jgi:hypothetical protein
METIWVRILLENNITKINKKGFSFFKKTKNSVVLLSQGLVYVGNINNRAKVRHEGEVTPLT